MKHGGDSFPGTNPLPLRTLNQYGRVLVSLDYFFKSLKTKKKTQGDTNKQILNTFASIF